MTRSKFCMVAALALSALACPPAMATGDPGNVGVSVGSQHDALPAFAPVTVSPLVAFAAPTFDLIAVNMDFLNHALSEGSPSSPSEAGGASAPWPCTWQAQATLMKARFLITAHLASAEVLATGAKRSPTFFT